MVWERGERAGKGAYLELARLLAQRERQRDAQEDVPQLGRGRDGEVLEVGAGVAELEDEEYLVAAVARRVRELAAAAFIPRLAQAAHVARLARARVVRLPRRDDAARRAPRHHPRAAEGHEAADVGHEVEDADLADDVGDGAGGLAAGAGAAGGEQREDLEDGGAGAVVHLVDLGVGGLGDLGEGPLRGEDRGPGVDGRGVRGGRGEGEEGGQPGEARVQGGLRARLGAGARVHWGGGRGGTRARWFGGARRGEGERGEGVGDVVEG